MYDIRVIKGNKKCISQLQKELLSGTDIIC